MNDLPLIIAALQAMAPGVKIEPKVADYWLVDDPEGDLEDDPSRDDLEARREAELGDMKSKFDREDSAI